MSGDRHNPDGKFKAFFDLGRTKPNPLKRHDATEDVYATAAFEFKPSDFIYAYANLNDQLNVSGKQYYVGKLENHFHFYIQDADKPSVSTTSDDPAAVKQKFQRREHAEPVGWKLHIFVAPYQLEAAWEIICKILMEHQVNDFKTICPDIVHGALMRKEPEAIATKQVSIYQLKNPTFDTKKWEEIIKQIEEALKANDISPGQAPKANKAIEGSAYFAYRNDANPDKPTKYISDSDAESLAKERDLPAYNLVKEEDPFASVRPFAASSLHPHK